MAGQLMGAVLLVGGAVSFSLVDAANGVAFLGFVGAIAVVCSVAMSRGLSRQGFDVPPVACAAASCAFPLLVFGRQESVLMVLLAVSVVALGMFFATRGFRNGVVKDYIASTFVVVYLGFLSSYAILVHQADRSRPLVAVVVIMALAYRWFSYLGRHFIADRPLWVGHSAGVVGCLMGASASVGLLGASFPPMLMLGALVGLACVVGDVAGVIVRTSLGRVNRGMLGRVDIALFAFPATFYWFRLFLT
ncbi:MAG: hypothetical protein ABIS18_05470 [Actinomycetota bacterium]